MVRKEDKWEKRMAGKAREDKKEERKVELGRVGRKCKGHWVDGVGEGEKKSGEKRRQGIKH